MSQPSRTVLSLIAAATLVGFAGGVHYMLTRPAAPPGTRVEAGAHALGRDADPATAALTQLHRCAEFGWYGAHLPGELRHMIRNRRRDRLPPYAMTAQLAAAAGAACGLSGTDWLAAVEYFGGMTPPAIHMDQALAQPLDPFRGPSFFGANEAAGPDDVLVLAVEPPQCAQAEHRRAITYAGTFLEVPATHPETHPAVARSAALAAHADALQRGDVDRVAPLLRHADPYVRREAVQALVRSGDARAVPALYQVFDDPEPDVRRMAVLGCAALGDRKVEPHLRAFLGNDTAFYGSPLHYRAVLALAALGFRDVRGELELMAGWHDPSLFPEHARAILQAWAQGGTG